MRYTFLFSIAPQPPVGQGLLIIDASRSHSDKPHSVGLLCTSDQPDAETSTWQYTTLTWDRYQCSRWDSKPQSQQASGCRPSSYTARPLRSARCPLYSHKYRCLQLATRPRNVDYSHRFADDIIEGGVTREGSSWGGWVSAACCLCCDRRPQTHWRNKEVMFLFVGKSADTWFQTVCISSACSVYQIWQECPSYFCQRIFLQRGRPCDGSGVKSLDCHRGGPGSIPGRSTCCLWWTKWYWAGFSPSTSVFPSQFYSVNNAYCEIYLIPNRLREIGFSVYSINTPTNAHIFI